jgi:hypothetical protein
VYGITDLRILWVIGALMLVFCGVGLVAAATVIGLPLYMAVAMLGVSQPTMVKVFVYSAIVWAPIGFGAGAAASSALLRGVRRESPPKQVA